MAMEEEWKILDPPGFEVAAVVDESGRTFYRSDVAGEYWYSDAPGFGRGNYAWSQLLEARGPVRAA
jgi:hypothetical protein